MSSERSAPDQVDAIIAAWRTELPELAPLPMELSKRLTRLAMLVDRVTAAELDELGLTKAEFEVLARLRSAGHPYRRRPNDLSKALFLTSGGTTNVLHRLTAAGLTERKADPEDRRSSWVWLTASGVATAERALRAVDAAQSRLFEHLPDAIGRALADQLREIHRMLSVIPV